MLIGSPAARRSAASAFRSAAGAETAPLFAFPAPLNFGERVEPWAAASPLLATPTPAGSVPASALVGLDGVSIGSTPALIDSFDSAKGQYGDGNKGSAAILISNGAVSIEGSKVYGDVRSTASGVTLKSSSLVTGSVTAGTTITNGGTIQGAATPNSPSTAVAAQAVTPCSPFSPAGSIGGKFTYNASTGDLTVNGNRTATLAAGLYCFHNLTLSGGGRLTASGPVTIHLTGQLGANGNSSAGAGGVPANLQVLSSYAGGEGVVLSGTTNLYMTIYAPQAGVILNGGPQLYGSVLAKTLSLTGNPSLHFDSQLATTIVNAAPVVSAGSDQTIVLPATATLSGSATDDGLPNPPGALTYQWSQVSGPAAASIANPAQPVTNVSFPAAGNYVFSLTASDGALGSSASVQVTVNPPVNHAPVVSVGTNQTITLPATATLGGSATDDGLPNPPGALANQWSQLSGPAQAAIASPSQPSTSVSFTTDGTYVFQFNASDGALSSSASVQVTVNPRPNQAPTVSAGADQTITLPATATLNGSATDDGLPSPPAALTLAWSQVSGPSLALVNTPTQAATTASFVQPGTYVLQLTASDGALSSSATTQITVQDGPPSLGSIPDRTIPAGSKYSMRLAANDPNANDTLSYFLDAAPAGATFDPNPAIVWTPTSAQVGVNDFTVRVVDAAGHSDSKTFHITVVAANHPPQLADQPDERVPSGGQFARTLSATDPDGDAVTLTLVSGPAGLTLTGNQLSWNPVTATPGTYPVMVQAADGAGLIDGKRFNLTVFAASAPAVRDDSYETSLGQTLSVPASGVLANDADPNGGALTAAKLTNPDKGTVSSFNADGSFTYVAPPSPAGPALDVTRAIAIAGGSPGSDSPVTVADVDGDGKPDLVVNQLHGPDHDIHVYRGDTGDELFHFDALPPAQVGGLGCYLFSGANQTLAAADVDDDGQVEIISGTNCTGFPGDPTGYTRIVAVAYDASQPEHFRVKWLSAPLVNSTGGTRVPSTSDYSVARLSPNEKPVVLVGGSVIGNQYCTQILSASTDIACRGVWALNGADGSLNRVYNSAPANQSNISQAYNQGIGPARGGFMGPVVADVDNDGSPEILYEGTLWNVDGTVKRQFDGGPNTATQSSAVVDLDGDAQMEIVTLDDADANNTPVGLLQAWKPGGQLLWRVPLPRSTVVTKLSVADVDRDGRPDIIFGIFNTLWVVDQSGHIKWLRNLSGAADNFGFQFGGSASAVTFPVYDLNGDGTPEIVVQYGNNTLRFLRGDTGEDETSWTYTGSPVWNSGGGVQTPVVADVDGSGHASVLFQHQPESFCGCETLVQVLRGDAVPWQPAPTHYNQEAYWESNFNADGSVPTTYTRQTADPRTNVFGQQPQAPYAPGFVPATDTSFTYSATNAAGLSSAGKVNIHITPQNRAPKFTSKPPTAYVQFNSVDYQAHAVDPDLGDTVTYGLAFSYGNNAVAAVDPKTGLVHLSQLNGGDQSFIVSATDNHGAVSYQPFILHQSAGFASVPDLAGMTQANAASSLSSALLSVGNITQQYTNAPAGTVLGQSPTAGTTLPQGESVDLTVSLGPAPVAVPNVVGNARTVALTTLSTSGFTATTTQVFSDAIPAGTVILQTPAAGTFVSPAPANPVSLTVSAGTGLSIALNRSVTTADQPITLTPSASDVNGNPIAVPSLTYVITPNPAPFMGALPNVSGTTITPGPDTVGSFTITATDAASSRSVSADFAVTPPRVAGTVTNGESFAHMSDVLEQIHALRPQLKAALAANDTAQMTALLQQLVTLWRTVDLDDLRISQPLVTPDKFAPTIDMMAGAGFSATPDDVVSQQVLKDSIKDLTAWTSGLKTNGVTVAQLNALADQFSTRAARLNGLAISPYGGINNTSQYTRLMTRSIPDFYEALTNELAQLTGMPTRAPSFPMLASGTGKDVKPSKGALSNRSLVAGRTKRRRSAAGREVRFINAAYRREPAQESLA
ncbi:MAG TPA: FG-GAP-like repeat-containing protein, partial [Pyrinomonadaceae bacterium]|nr:FG-GAP-like repeat-containing protein [Pyrinomonadaceae bacterium]